MLHPEEQKLMSDLNGQYAAALERVFERVKAKFAERGKQYDHDRPYRYRFNNLESYATILGIKADRTCSELRVAQESDEPFDPDNAVDLIAYTAMMLAELDVLKEYLTPPTVTPFEEPYVKTLRPDSLPTRHARPAPRSAEEIEQELRTYVGDVRDPNKE